MLFLGFQSKVESQLGHLLGVFPKNGGLICWTVGGCKQFVQILSPSPGSIMSEVADLLWPRNSIFERKRLDHDQEVLTKTFGN